MRILPTNKLLYTFKYVNSNLCDFCYCQIETFEHLFWECHILQPLWSNLNNVFKENSINYVIKKKDILLELKSENSVNSAYAIHLY